MTRWFVYKLGKATRQKPHQVILRSPLPRIHYYQNKQLQVKESQYLILTYSWTFIPISNWTCSIVTISHFQCMPPSTWLINRCTDLSTRLYHQLEKDVGCKVLQFITWWKSRSYLVTKPYGVQTQQLLQEKDELGHMSSVHNMLLKFFFIKLHQLWRPIKQSLYMFRVVRKESLSTYSQIGLKSTLKNWIS